MRPIDRHAHGKETFPARRASDYTTPAARMAPLAEATTYTTPDAAVAAALDGLRQTIGWGQLSVSLARYLLARKHHPFAAKLWVESVFANLNQEARK